MRISSPTERKGGVIVSSDPEPISKNQKTKKPSDLLGSDGGRSPLMAYLVTPTGVEPVLPP